MMLRALFHSSMLFAVAAVSSCTPSLPIAGSYFPAWIVCMVSGLIAASLCRAILALLGIDRYVKPAALAYPCLALALTLLTWLLFYPR